MNQATAKKTRIEIWIPMGFCALLSSLMLFGPKDVVGPAFYSFLPLCFLFVGSSNLALQKRLAVVEEQLQPTASTTMPADA